MRRVRWLAVLFCVIVLQAQTPAGRTEASVQAHYRKAQEAIGRQDYVSAEAEFRAILRLQPDLAEGHANLGSVFFMQGDYLNAAESFRAAILRKPSFPRAEMFLGMSLARLGRGSQALVHLERSFPKDQRRAGQADEWELQAGLMLAELYAEGKDYGKAIDVAGVLRAMNPTSPDILYLTYRLHSVMGSDAVASLVKVAPGSARLHQVAAELSESEGNFPAAAAQYRDALRLNSKLVGVRRSLAVALMSSSSDEATRIEARRYLEQELALNPADAHSEYQLGELMWLENEPVEAQRRFVRAIELNPNFADALIAAGKAYTLLGQPDRAIDLLRRAVEIDSQNEVVHYRLAQAYRKSGRPRESAEAMARFRQIRSAMESLRTIQRQLLGVRVTGQTVDRESQ